ncbi:hypothetical protein predicted by Glimmer/Critica [Sorangium cellulosum So ce56]|uniref:Uncharacterized protein n=1 Tax=Sorangium cellulosum (strain So ce56) TaxID=448385 RepID=A9GE73_SORC5|nr:hypothetical protein [Sorangium cellulosum]CAN99452.1 hypothetical protein predicted by Glimmer/Critica [Sorangium cellulosum So ce56]
MRSSKDVALRGRSAAVFHKLVALITALAVLAPSFAWATTPYTVLWMSRQDATSCADPELETEGAAIFEVNQTPLPTYGIPGAVEIYGDGSASNTLEAEFDSVLLRMGANDFHFGVHVNGGDWCTHAHDVVHIVSEPLGLNKPLFDIRRDGTGFEGDTDVDLSLAEINPTLARDIAELEVAIGKLMAAILRNAAKIADLRARMDLLRQLDTELHDLVTRPLDEISRTELDAILDRYKDVVDPPTRAAMEQLVDDLKKSVSDLEDELARLMDEFGAQADEVADLATQDARAEGWNPDDPWAYALGESEVPWVEVPDIAEADGAFDEGRDPYAAYADGVIAALEKDVSGGAVVARADFVANVRAWRANSAALEIALRDRMGVSLAETNAFLKAQNRITAVVRKFMDASDWFIETPIPPDLRAQVDTVLKPRFDALADQMKDNLNLWTGDELDLEQTQLYQTISAFAGAMSTVAEGFEAYAEVMQTLVHATTRIGVGFVPVVGPALDLCEAVTGKAWCLPSGRELSDEERIFSGVGFGVAAIGPMWRVIKTASGLRPAAIRVAGEIAEIEEVFAKIVKTNRVRGYKTLTGAITTEAVNIFEKKAAKFLVDDGRALIGVGDDGVRRVLDIPKESRTGTIEGKAPDFVSLRGGNELILSEAKGGDEVIARDVIEQLTNAMETLKTKWKLHGDVARLELIMKQGATFDNKNIGVRDGYLINLLTGKPVAVGGKFVMVIRL